MNLDQLRKAYTEGRELEYLFDDDQWVPATLVYSPAINADSPTVAFRLLRCPVGHSGFVDLDADDIQHRLRLKGTN